MALIQCPECGKEISDKAEKCIHCGCPINNSKTELKEGINKEDIKKETKKVKVPWKIIAGVLASIFVILVGITLYVFLFSPSAQYEKAEKAFASGNYEKAMKHYEKAGDYEDSKIKYEQSSILFSYYSGLECIENQEWEAAKEYLQQCSEYEDSAEHLKKCDYNIALGMLANGEYADAKSLFESLEYYDESKLKIGECNYYLARDLEEQGSFLEAAQLYGDSGAFDDADERIEAIGDKFLEEEKYEDAIEIYNCLSYKAAPNCKGAKYADGKIKLENNDLLNAAVSFKNAGDYLDADDLYKESTYGYAQSLMANDDFTSAKSQFNNILSYKDSKDQVSSCELMLAKADMNNGNLNTAKKALEKLSPETSYNGISAETLLGYINSNSQYVNICGQWSSTGGQMRSTQNGSYRDYYWYVDFKKDDVTVDIKCPIDDKGNVSIKISGSIPVFTNYSSISSALKRDNVSLSKTVSSMGTISINDNTTVTISSSQITAKYKKVDRTQDVYFSYTYETNVTYGSKKSSY